MAFNVYTVDELVPILHLQPRAIGRLLATGKLRGRRVGKRWLVTEEAVQLFLGTPVAALSERRPQSH